MTQYEVVIGLEIHAQMQTESKMFCGAPVVDSVSAEPNTAVLPLCLGMPGILPVINKRAVEMAIRVGLVLNCTINHFNQFARKNYFYPDLTKGYQISQHEEPIATNGWLDVILPSGATKRIGIRRVHMEEDPGKLTHAENGGSLVDYNRSGVPLLEIVSEPDIRSAEEATAYATQLRQILRYLDINSGDLEKGVMRVEPNISLRPVGTIPFGTRTEVKNLNSFRALHDATEYEIARQTDVLNAGDVVAQETRGWDEKRQRTFTQRSKEDAHDYRYFPDPDLPALLLDDELIAEIRAQLPELPIAKSTRYQQDWGLSAYDAELLTEEKAVAYWFEQAIAEGGQPKAVANFLLNNLFKLMNASGSEIEAMKVTPANLVQLTQLVEKGTISNNIAKKVLVTMYETGDSAETIVTRENLAQISDESAILAIIQQAITDNPDKVAAYRAGRTKLRGFFVGQVMRAMCGKANPAIVNKLLDKELS